MNKIKNINAEYWFYGFLLMHVTAWTLAPTLMRYNLPLDAMEGTTWGKQFAWGYDKNPYMMAWLTKMAILVGGSSGFATYFFSQLSVAICFKAIWQLGKHMLQPLYALVAVILLEGIQYYNLHAIDFSDNTLELATWALTLLFFYQAIRYNKLSHWLLTGVFAGLSMMTKYYSIMLIIPMILFLLINRDARAHLKTYPPYLSLLVFFIIVTPHLIWLCTHHFITLNYAIGRVSVKTHSWSHHFFYAFKFVIDQFETLIPVLLLIATFHIGKNPIFTPVKLSHLDKQFPIFSHTQISHFDKQFLFFTAICPFLSTVLLSIMTGMHLRAAWGQPLFSLWGIVLIIWLKPNVTPAKFFHFIIVLIILSCITITLYCTNITRGKKPSSANFPGDIISHHLTSLWHEKYQTPLKYVAGGRWLAGNISFYSPDHPNVYIDWNERISPWINEKELRKDGAIFVWDLTAINRRKEIPIEAIKKQFPTIGPIKVFYFTWHHNKTLPPAEIQVAFLPPTHQEIGDNKW